MIPTSIDGTDITGATIDGTDVQEITVDGDVVFTAGPTFQDPVAKSSLVAWYPFINGLQDETSVNGVLQGIGVGDSTDYTLTSTTETINNSGGVTDISTGANSAELEFNRDNTGPNTTQDVIRNNASRSLCYWVNLNDLTVGSQLIVSLGNNDMIGGVLGGTYRDDSNTIHYRGHFNDFDTGYSPTQGVYEHHVWTYDGSDVNFHIDGGTSPFASGSVTVDTEPGLIIGSEVGFSSSRAMDGRVDDVRVYNKSLSGSEINQIYQNTQP